MSKVAQDVIVKPLITEKATLIKDDGNQVAFEVALWANKVQVRRAIEELFDVKVDEVRTLVVAGKRKRRGLQTYKRPNWKKAIVRLAPGSELDLLAL